MEQEEFFDVFEMIPRTAQDVYYNKLLNNSCKNAIVQTGSDNVEMEVQTEEIGTADKYNQAPDDVLTTYKQDDSVSFVSKKQKKDNDALKLEKFMARAGPVMELCVEENTKMR